MSWQLGAFDDKQHQEHLEEAFEEVEKWWRKVSVKNRKHVYTMSWTRQKRNTLQLMLQGRYLHELVHTLSAMCHSRHPFRCHMSICFMSISAVSPLKESTGLSTTINKVSDPWKLLIVCGDIQGITDSTSRSAFVQGIVRVGHFFNYIFLILLFHS